MGDVPIVQRLTLGEMKDVTNQSPQRQFWANCQIIAFRQHGRMQNNH